MGKLGSSTVSTKYMMSLPKSVRIFLNVKVGDSLEFYSPEHDFKEDEVRDCAIVKVVRK